MLTLDNSNPHKICAYVYGALDEEIILNSVQKTGRLIIADVGWKTVGIISDLWKKKYIIEIDLF